MKIRDSPKIGIKFIENNTSKFVDITDKKSKIYIEFDYILEVSQISKKRLDLYLWRHKIKKYKYKNNKYVPLEVLDYLFNIIERGTKH